MRQIRCETAGKVFPGKPFGCVTRASLRKQAVPSRACPKRDVIGKRRGGGLLTEKCPFGMR